MSMYSKKFPFALQTIFSIHNLEADIFFSQLQLANNFLYEKGNPQIKNNGPSLTENLIFDGTSGMKLEMMSYSDNAYNATSCLSFSKVLKKNFCPSEKFEKPILYSYQISLLLGPKWQS